MSRAGDGVREDPRQAKYSRVGCACNSSALGGEAGGLQVPAQPGSLKETFRIKYVRNGLGM